MMVVRLFMIVSHVKLIAYQTIQSPIIVSGHCILVENL